jgi:hypothetical protein
MPHSAVRPSDRCPKSRSICSGSVLGLALSVVGLGFFLCSATADGRSKLDDDTEGARPLNLRLPSEAGIDADGSEHAAPPRERKGFIIWRLCFRQR